MKKLFTVLMLLAAIALTAVPVQAAYIDLRPDGIIMGADGEAYDPGDGDVSLEVWIMPDAGDTTLDNYSFDIWYDSSETIDYISGTNTPPVGWFPLASETVVDTPPDHVYSIEGFTFGTGVSLAGGVQVATLEFDFDYGALILDGTADFSVDYRGGQALTVDGAVITPGSVSADLVNPVPIPGALLLFTSGIMTFLGVRRKK